ncbi:MAG: hypothetical protein RLZZ468_232 [Cyanobacteriota bacterium]|jgi:hypothetical protein
MPQQAEKVLAAIAGCGRVYAWSQTASLETLAAWRGHGWQVGQLSYGEILEREPACHGCRRVERCLTPEIMTRG